MPTSSPSAITTDAPRLFPLFALLWAFVTLVHQISDSFWIDGWIGWLLVISASAVIFEPRCLVRFTAMVIVSLANLYPKMPFVPNHILFEGMIHITILIGMIEVFLRGGLPGPREAITCLGHRLLPLSIAAALKAIYLLTPPISENIPLGAITTLLLALALGRFIFQDRPTTEEIGERFIASLAPAIRWSLVILYLWSVIQKLNGDYFDPSVSCAVIMNAEIASHFPFIGDTNWTLLGIWGTFAFELGIPVLLLIPRTRSLGIFAAILFHLWLAIHSNFGIFSFSALALAVLALFLSAPAVLALEKLWKRQMAGVGGGDHVRGHRKTAWLTVIAFIGTMIAQGSCYLILERSIDIFWTANRIGYWLFALWSIWLCASYLIAIYQTRKASPALLYRARPTWAWLGLSLVLLNGICPWIGLKTQTSFSMYSNLRTEINGNHLFLKRIDLFHYQTDMVELIASEPDLLAIGPRPRSIQQFANPGRIFPWFELRRLVSESKGNLTLTYRQANKTHTASRINGETSGNPALFRRHPLALSKLLWFRRHTTLTDPMHCTH